MQTQEKIIRRVLIIANLQKGDARSFAKDIELYLDQLGMIHDTIFMTDAESSITVAADTDLAICLGGDGTVLSCARMLHPYGIPMLAVNLGTFGFITEVCKNEWQETFDLYRMGKATVSRRLLVRVSVTRNSEKVFQGHGLNEVTLSASGISKMVSLDLLINGTNAGKIRSDGIIVATPTGSTGYSLAAGGPILDVTLDALIINPVCPFTLSNRPLVVAGEDVIDIVVRSGQRTQVALTLDGQVLFSLQEGDRITVEKARSKALLIMSPLRNYYEVVRDKLNWSGGMHA
jgi:NAD+ kinase